MAATHGNSYSQKLLWSRPSNHSTFALQIDLTLRAALLDWHHVSVDRLALKISAGQVRLEEVVGSWQASWHRMQLVFLVYILSPRPF